MCGLLISPESENDTDEDEFARRGWLVAVKGSYVLPTFEDHAESEFRELFGSSASFSVDDSFGISGHVGYRRTLSPRSSDGDNTETPPPASLRTHGLAGRCHSLLIRLKVS